MMITYFVWFGFAVFSIGIAGIAAGRHLPTITLSVIVALLASTLLAVSFFYYGVDGDITDLLLVIWSVSAAEVMALMVLYRYLAKWGVSTDITKLSKLRH
jgi:NADH:ubiquinone oxidoreductase subunit K